MTLRIPFSMITSFASTVDSRFSYTAGAQGPPVVSMVLLLDNHDSFVYNLARYVSELGLESHVRLSDSLSIQDVLDLAPSHIILSPGPCTPNEAGICTEVVRAHGARIPILGVCLGHQCIGEAYGG